MKDDLDKNFVQSLLENYGFQIKPIPETTNKTPDLWVVMSGNSVIIEVKSKADDIQLRDLLESQIGNSLSYNKASIETCLRDAWRQIRDFPERDASDFTLIWFITRKLGSVTVLVNSVTKPILYGTELLSGQTIDRKSFDFVNCYFFNESLFFKRKDLDGVVLHDDKSLELCLNPYSPRRNKFNNTKLMDLFKNHYSVVDPIEIEAGRKAFIVDCDIQRQDKNGIVRYLKDKYRLDTVSINRLEYINCPVD